MPDLSLARLGVIVTNDAGSARLLEKTLTDMGYRVMVTDDTEPQRVLRAPQHCALLVLDCDLPGIDLMAWREYVQPIHAPLLCLTSDESRLPAAFSEGADDYLLKPFTPARLLYRLGALLRAHDYYTSLYTPHLSQPALHQLANTSSTQELLAVLYHTATTLNRSLDRDIVLDQIVYNMRRVIPSEFTALLMIDPDGMGRFVRIRGYDTFVSSETMYALEFPVREMFTFSTMLETQQSLIIPDVLNDPRWVPYSEFAFERSYVGAPIIIQDEVVGFLNVSHRQPNIYNEQHGRLLEILAAQAGIALNNARLYDTVLRHSAELEARLRELLLVYETGQNLQATLDEEKIVLALFRSVRDYILPFTHMKIITYNPDHGQFEQVFTVHSAEEKVTTTLAYNPHLLTNEALCAAVARFRTHVHDSWIYEPLISRNRVIGVWSLHTAPDYRLTDVNLTLLSTLSARAALALDNARLYQQISSHAETLERRVVERTAKLNEALLKERELVDMKTRFVKNVSHEFRTRLALIQSANQMVERYGDRMTDDERAARYQVISDTVKDLTLLLQDALTINEWEEGGMHYRPISVDLAQITETILSDFIQESQTKADIRYTVNETCTQAILDANLWRRILSELLQNAVKYSRTGGTIEVSLSCDLNDIRLTVQDYGIGIPADDLPHVFEMFHRGSNASNIVGSGLGLTILQRAVEIHHGTIYIHSEEGSGTTVIVTLPRYATEVG